MVWMQMRPVRLPSSLTIFPHSVQGLARLCMVPSGSIERSRLAYVLRKTTDGPTVDVSVVSPSRSPRTGTPTIRPRPV